MERASIFSPFELKIYIEFLRIDLIDKGMKFGFGNETTILASQELDFFIYQYQVLTGSKLPTDIDYTAHSIPISL